MIAAAVLAMGISPAASESHNEGQSTNSQSAVHTDSSDGRVHRLIDRGISEEWGADELLEYLGLHEASQCHSFADRAFLRERHERWAEAVRLLERINPEALHAWLLGLSSPPQAALAEVNAQLRCLLQDLIAASRFETYNIRLFPHIRGHFGGHVRDATHLADLIDERPTWLRRTINALTRSAFRNMGTQGFIWYRKFRFEGRNFNLVSEEAALACGLAAGQTWKPEHPAHQRCWQRTLTPTQREQEILTASAAPGVSRHHWGTDTDILGLNPRTFVFGGALHDDWRWLDAHALDHGFFQPYGPPQEGFTGHMEERWHWSYYPIGQALWDHVHQDPDSFEEALFSNWDRLERRWGTGRGPFFDYMRQNWHSYLFHIKIPTITDERSVDADHLSPSFP